MKPTLLFFIFLYEQTNNRCLPAFDENFKRNSFFFFLRKLIFQTRFEENIRRSDFRYEILADTILFCNENIRSIFYTMLFLLLNASFVLKLIIRIHFTFQQTTVHACSSLLTDEPKFQFQLMIPSSTVARSTAYPK